MNEIDISSLFQKAFGYELPTNASKVEVDKRRQSSQIGAAFYGNDLFGREHFLPVTLNGYLIPFAVLVDK